MSKALSYSELSSWLYSKDEWYKRYILGETEEPNSAMVLGKLIHSALEDPKYPWLMALKQIKYKNVAPIRKILNKMANKTAPSREVRMTAETKEGIPLLAYWDGFDKKNKVLYEYKTSIEVGAWAQWKVDSARQLSFYSLMYKLKWHSFFREIRLFYLDLTRGTVETFLTARGPEDIKKVAQEITNAVIEMEANHLWDKRLTTQERNNLSQTKLPSL